MTQSKLLLLWGLLACAAALLVNLNGCGGGATSNSSQGGSSQKIEHVVVIFQENRTPDNLFQGLPNADIATSGVNSTGRVISLTPISFVTDYDLSHGHKAFVDMWDNGKMDGADKVNVNCVPGATDCPPENAQFHYVDQNEVAPYLALASTYTFGDRMFQTNQGPSFPAHQFIISGTSAPTATSNLFAAENPSGVSDADTNTGCTAPANETVGLIDPSTGDESQKQYPCFDHPTLTDLLNGKGVSWRYYTAKAGSIWTGPNAIKHMCKPDASGTTCKGSDWTNNVILKSKQVLTDIASGQLPAVTWVIPTGQASDHAVVTDGSGPSWVASVVNAIGNSQYWSNTAIIIAWDDWGGWYDHVSPPIHNAYEYGFRVPLIVVSPYAKPAYVSHVTHDFGSILKFIEVTFGLSTVAPGYADTIADDLSDCFDFNQTPLTFQTVPAVLNASHFLNDTRPPSDPDDD